MRGLREIVCENCGRGGGQYYLDGGINWGEKGDYEITSLSYEIDLNEGQEFKLYDVKLCPSCFRKIIFTALENAGVEIAAKIFKFDSI
ncbi:hypothetical protein JD969_20370 [Planctomycetota bacterium]|nr:hypothetical protein JD969_20370 [Planctomycetota bacterium]